MQHDVFISFSFKDQRNAEDLVNLLSGKYGITCWICTRELEGGGLYKAMIPDAIDAAKVVIFLQSESSVASREVPKEIGLAFDAEKLIIPFRIDGTPLKAELRYDLYGVEYIDATVPTFEERVDELAQTILKALGNNADDTKNKSRRRYELTAKPLGCSEIFFGREREMEALHEAFETRNTVFLRGMGGIGKSEFAKQYARKYRSEYDCVVFAHYDGSIASLLANDSVFHVTGLFKKANADGTQQSDEEYARTKLEILNSISDKRTLIILDNFDVTGDPMLETFATNQSYRLLVTSRLEPERGKYYVQPIEELDDEVLRDLVVEFANPNTTMVSRDDPDFPELFALTSRHTLTLELIGYYMEEQCIDEIGEVVALLKERQISFLEEAQDTQRASAIRNLFRMTEMSENEKSFLRWLALTSPDGIGHKIFKSWVGTEVFAARTRLATLGMVRMDGVSKKISLHPIVRQIVQSELKATLENSKPFFDKIKEDVYTSWNWPLAQKLMIADSSVIIMEQLGPVSKENFDLYYTLGINRNFVFPKSKMLPFWEELYQYALRSFGENSLQAGLCAYRVGWFCQYCDLDAMKTWLEDRAYPILKQNRDSVLVEFPHTITNLATLYRKKHDIDPKPEYLALLSKYCDEALTEMTRSHNDAIEIGNDNAAGRTYIMIAGVYMVRVLLGIKMRDRACVENAIAEIDRRIPPERFSDYAEGLALKGQYHFAFNEFDAAVAIFEDALAKYAEIFQEINSYSMDIHVFLARCMEQLHQPEQAYEHWDKAYRMADALLVKNHPTLAIIRDGLARNKQTDERRKEAPHER